MSELAFHPLANLFPLIEGAAFAELVADICANGLHEKIVLLDDAVLDGRNRYRAGVAAGLFEPLPSTRQRKLWFREHDASEDGEALRFVLSRNLHRRHLSESQRAMVAARLANMGHGGDRRSDDRAANLPLEDAIAAAPEISQAQAASALKVSERSLRTAKTVIEHGAAELVGAVEQGAVSVSAAADLAGLPAEEQRAAVLSADPAVLYRVIREKRALDQAAKKEKRAAREAGLGERIAAGNVALAGMVAGGKRYGVILADPEWRFEPWSRESGMDRAADNHYPTSPTQAICARPVAEIAAADAVLLLWATAPMLPDALAVMAAWGFTYRSHAVWLKDAVGTGYWFRSQHELLLLGTRGDVPAPAMGTQFRSALAHAVAEHSAKPPFAHEIAEAYFPSLPKIELNARQARPGWDVWGAEAPDLVLETSAGDEPCTS